MPPMGGGEAAARSRIDPGRAAAAPTSSSGRRPGIECKIFQVKFSTFIEYIIPYLYIFKV
jgi:hypothetical protein